MYENTLFPVDDSEDSNEILHHVGGLTNWADATIRLLFVADTIRDGVTVVENTVVDALVQEDEGIVEDAGKTLLTLGVEYETDVVQGNLAPIIAEYADRYGHDLIVMSAHGREGMSRYLRDSVSEKVVRPSSVPVLTTRVQPDEQLVFPYENVFITADDSAGTTRATQHGLALVESLEATVRILSVVDSASLSLDIRSTISKQEHGQTATEAAKEIIENTETYGVTDTAQHIKQGDPADIILNCIDANDTHVVMMGTTGGHDMDRIPLGNVAKKTVRSAPVPVFAISEVEQHAGTTSR